MTTGPATDGVMLMAYGAPASLEAVGEYFTHIRGGRRPPEERVEELRSRYRAIGGVETLLRITEEQGRALQEVLAADGGSPVAVFTGMRHSRPFIHERIRDVAAAGVRRLVGLPMAPHYSSMSVGAYHRALRDAAASVAPGIELLLVESWHDHPRFIAALAAALRETLAAAKRDASATRDEAAEPIVLFTAHSLPRRIVEAGEPYRDQLLTTARLVAESAAVRRWELAFQSASPTGEPWLGPDILASIRSVVSEGGRALVIAPVGFVADHLEILYDVDHLCRRAAEDLGARLWRTPSMNVRPDFIGALAAITRARLRGTT
jgi:ferrochelatase